MLKGKYFMAWNWNKTAKVEHYRFPCVKGHRAQVVVTNGYRF